MDMKKHLIVIGTVVLLLVVGFSGCMDYSSPKSDIEGIWYEHKINGEWNFLENGTLYFTYDDIIYGMKWDMDSYYVYTIEDDYTRKHRYTFLDDDNTLLLEHNQFSHTLRRE